MKCWVGYRLLSQTLVSSVFFLFPCSVQALKINPAYIVSTTSPSSEAVIMITQRCVCLCKESSVEANNIIRRELTQPCEANPFGSGGCYIKALYNEIR